MKREKKISFKYSLYKTKKPSINENGEGVFPIYMRVVYNQKSTKFLLRDLAVISKFEIEPAYTEQKFEDWIEQNPNLRELEKLVAKIIRYENKNEANYSIVGIHQRLSPYDTELTELLGKNIYNEVKIFLGDYFTFNALSTIMKFSPTVDYNFDYTISFYKEFDELAKSYYKHESINNPNLKIVHGLKYNPATSDSSIITALPLELKNKIIALFYLTVFYNYNERQNLVSLRYIDWIDNNSVKSEIKDFVGSSNFDKEVKILCKSDEYLKFIKDELNNEIKGFKKEEFIRILNFQFTLRDRHMDVPF